ncbi:DUF550 domain-containing protein [Salmonella enterica subsp. enterica serovar Newport]|nr:DUF550 domain-containing protein [Salmonella enterica subsp. enterica serovar Newport]MCR6016320.1 DUF550 domain-containing protein [Salmonella enterica subsp. enterica serovar Newport]
MTTITREEVKAFIEQIESDLSNGWEAQIFELKLARIALASLDAEPVAYNQVQRDMMKDIIVRKMGENLAGEKLVMDDIHAVTMALIDAGFRAAPPVLERERIRREHAEWSDKTFGDVGPIGPLKHLSKEALEAAAEPDDLSEWADMQFLLWDAQRRAGISDEQITQAMVEKLAVNKQREWPVPRDGEPRLHIKDMPAPVMPAELHPDTQNLVADFCTALAEKLYKAQLKYGYDADWKQDGWHTQCLSHFHQHIAKGDPRDVAAYCAFMWYHGWKTESVSGPVVPDDGRAEFEAWMLKKWGRERQEYDFAMSKFLHGENYADSYTRHMWKAWTESRAAMIQSKYRDLSQPVDPQISEYEKIMLRAGWVMVPVEPTDEMIAAAMNCEDVLFNSDESFCVQFGNIYEAMLAAAPQHEVK